MEVFKTEQLYEYEESSNDNGQCSNLLMSILHRNWDHVKSILQSNDFVNEIKQGILPKAPVLHVTCSVEQVPTEIIDLIFHVYGNECCNIQDEDGNLAIHKACSKPGVSIDTIRKLFLISPKTSKLLVVFNNFI